MGIFDKLFDFNHDGHADAFETTLGFMMMDEMEQSGNHPGSDLDDPTADDPTLSVDLFDDEDVELLDATGYDRDELEWMDADERAEILEDAGYEPSDFGFDDF